MSLICTEAAIKYGAPDYDGMVTQFGLSRDWRPSENWRGYNCEYIKPLGAIGPVADARPRSMDASDWTVSASYNQNWVPRYPAFVNSVRSMQFADGSVYTGSEGTPAQGVLRAGTWCESVLPRFALYIIRSMPPAGQVQPTAVNVMVPGLYDDGGTLKASQIVFYFPLAGDSSETGKKFSEPFIHQILLEDIGEDDYYSLFTEGDILSKGPRASSARQGSGREGWIIEYEEDATLYDGGHILIRNTGNMDQWWHFYDPRVRLASKDAWDAAGVAYDTGDDKWAISAIGAVQTVNLTPLLYGAAAASCWPDEPRPLPHEVDANEVEDDAWNDTASWGELKTDADGWSVSTAQAADGTRRPQTIFTPAAGPYYARPILWLQTEDYPAVFSAASATPRGDTDGDGVLEGLVWTWGKDFKGSRGSASFYRGDAAIYETWVERANCLLEMGWSSEAGASLDKQEITQAYIMPGGLPRDRSGDEYMGAPGLGPVQFGAFDSAILPDKPLIDVRQAGGMTVEDWAGMIADRLGIPSGKLYVDAAVASILIPTNAIPSKPHLAAGDGESAGSHIAAVEKAAGIRVCWNKTTSYVMWVDGGAPAYVPGTSTISLQIDYNTLTEQNMVYDIEHAQSAQRAANALKVRYGREDQVGGQSEYYQAQPVAHRELHLQGDFWAYYEDPDADRDELVGRYNNERKAGDSRLSWRMPLRVDLLPDLFVQVTDCPYLGITTDAVYQIEEHTADQAAAESRLVARLVYVDDEQIDAMASGGAFDADGAVTDPNTLATLGALEG